LKEIKLLLGIRINRNVPLSFIFLNMLLLIKLLVFELDILIIIKVTIT